MIRAFRDPGTEDVFDARDSKRARYRICFVWTEQGPDQVEIVDYHG